MKTVTKLIGLVLIYSLLIIPALYAGQTGSIKGTITDNETGEPIIGANVLIEGTYLGAAADFDGYYFINNVPPGTYNLIVSSVGYHKTTVTNVIVKIDLTTTTDVELVSEAVEVDEVVVTAERPLITRDLTSTKVSVSSEEMELMPVENIHQVINLQAGVVGGHFRGGRSGEVAYLIDGIPVNDVYDGGMSVQVENNAVRELEVISGTFNAEYGQALSGVVNIVTKEGSEEFKGNVAGYFGTNYSLHDDLFYNLDEFGSNKMIDLQASFGGPTKIIKGLTFFVSGRYVDDDGYHFGKNIYSIDDNNPYIHEDGTPVVDPVSGQITGYDDYVAMNPSKRYSINAKIAFNQPSWKVAYSLFYDDRENKYYDHGYRWSPNGLLTHLADNIVHNVQLSIYPSQSIYSTLKFSYAEYSYDGYMFEDPFDPRHVSPLAGNPETQYTYRYGGHHSNRYERYTKTLIGQWSLEAQLNKEHKAKVGAEVRLHNMYNHGYDIVNLTEGVLDSTGQEIFTMGYRDLGSPGNQDYTKYPFEASAFIQDKMEYDIMIINAGVRLDYFNANTTLPADLRNPSRLNPNPDFPGAGESTDVEAKMQISPRLGVSFPISDQGAIYFSYGHFFQIPTYSNLYQNDEYIINPGQSLSSVTGNPNLEAQKTIKYELGIQQVLFPNISLDATVYYSDIRNLLGMEIVNTYEGFKYARFINRDYGNVKGLILTIDKRFADFFSAKIDYTYQVAQGNASDPMAVFNDNQSDPPVESEKKVVPLNWDQTSTVNFMMTVGDPGDWTAGLIFSYGSGMPYTEDIQISNGVRFENGGRRPATFNLDLRMDKVFMVGGLRLYATLLVYNVLDIKNEYGVYATTGRANSDLNTKYAGEVYGLNTINEYVLNPGMYSSPRHIRLGVSMEF